MKTVYLSLRLLRINKKDKGFDIRKSSLLDFHFFSSIRAHGIPSTSLADVIRGTGIDFESYQQADGEI